MAPIFPNGAYFRFTLIFLKRSVISTGHASRLKA